MSYPIEVRRWVVVTEHDERNEPSGTSVREYPCKGVFSLQAQIILANRLRGIQRFVVQARKGGRVFLQEWEGNGRRLLWTYRMA